MAAAKERALTKNEKKRAKKKAQKALAKDAPPEPPSEDLVEEGAPPMPDEPEEISPTIANVEVEYISASLEEELEGADMEDFKAVFEKFTKVEELTKAGKAEGGGGKKSQDEEGGEEEEEEEKKDEGGGSEEEEDEDEEGGGGLSKKARKKMSRLSVAELKQLVTSPDVVEAHDVTSADPRLLVYLKAYRNTVPVPRHWCHKRKYLQGKRGIDKAPFQLPEFIGATGIEKIRTAVMEQEALQTQKQKGRARVAPKMGKIDIDYQVLHDAFFKYQKKPSLSSHGDVYYEGKEFEVTLREKTPGHLTASLKEACAIPEGAPPPWLVNMQRYGPPPAYPNLKISGLNAPIPAGCKFGFQPGEWGKPPVDEYGRPLYGDVFSTEGEEGGLEGHDEVGAEAVDRTLWGELGSESEEEEEEEEEEESDEEGQAEGGEEGGGVDGAETPSGFASTMSGATSVSTAVTGLDTPSDSLVDLRKRQQQQPGGAAGGLETPDTSGVPSEQPEQPKVLYQVVGEQKAAVGTSGIFGAEKAYVLPGQQGQGGGDGAGGGGGAESIVKHGAEADDSAGALEEEQRKRKRKAEKEKADKKKKKDDFKF